jgi:hypothetical protein
MNAGTTMEMDFVFIRDLRVRVAAPFDGEPACDSSLK